MAIYNVPNQLQPKWPLRIDDTFGPYASVANVQESIKQDFVFLLKTVQGEWPNRPDLSNIRYKIAEQLKKYLPIVSLESAEFVSTENDQDNLSTVLRISYNIRNLNTTDTLEINLTKVEPSEVYIGDLNSEIAKMGGFE